MLHEHSRKQNDYMVFEKSFLSVPCFDAPAKAKSKTLFTNTDSDLTNQTYHLKATIFALTLYGISEKKNDI